MTKLLISFIFFNMIFLSPAFGFIVEADELNTQGASHLPKPLVVSTAPEEDALDSSFVTERTDMEDDAEESPDTTFSLSPFLKKECLIQIATEQVFQEERFEGIISKVCLLPQNVRTFKDNLEKVSQKSPFKAVKKLLDPANPHAVNALFEDKKLKGTLQFLRTKFTVVMDQIRQELERDSQFTRSDRVLLADELFIPHLLLKFLKDQRDSACEAAFFLKNKLHSLGQNHQKKIKKKPLYLENLLNLSRHLLILNRLISQINLGPSSDLSFSHVMSLDFWGIEDASYDVILESCLNSNPLDPDIVAQLYDHYTQEAFARIKASFNYLEIVDSEFLATLRVAQQLKATYDQLNLVQRSFSVRSVERKPFRPSLLMPSRASSSAFEAPISPSFLDQDPRSLLEARHSDSGLFSLPSSSSSASFFTPIGSDPRTFSSQGRAGSSSLLY